MTSSVITVNEASAALTDDGVTVTCEISNPHDWTSIVMTHTPVSQSDSEAQQTTTIVTLERTGKDLSQIFFFNLYSECSPYAI